MRRFLTGWWGMVVLLVVTLSFQLALVGTDHGASVFFNPLWLVLAALGVRSGDRPLAALAAAVFAGLVMDAFTSRLFLINSSFSLLSLLAGFGLHFRNLDTNPLISGAAISLIALLQPVLASFWLVLLGEPGFWSRLAGLAWLWWLVFLGFSVAVWPVVYRAGGEVLSPARG